MLPRPRILFVDAYDSFSNNIIALLESELEVEVSKIFIDTHIDDLVSLIEGFEAVVCGPGPGHPINEQDVGLFNRIWALPEETAVPVLGICLGFQSLALHYGGTVDRLPRPRHGLETDVTSSRESIFRNVPLVRSVQYHSLHVSLGHVANLGEIDDTLWKASAQVPQLIPLAWDFSKPGEAGRLQNPSAILMALRHRSRPFYGVQFHPESICSAESAKAIVRNWWDLAQIWNSNFRKHLPLAIAPDEPRIHFHYLDDSESETSMSPYEESPIGSPFPLSTSPSSLSLTTSRLETISMDLGDLTVPAISQALGLNNGEIVVLDSEMRLMEGLGTSSIIGLVEFDTTKVAYSVGNNFATMHCGNENKECSLSTYGDNVFNFLKEFTESRAISESNDSVFSGGFMGYITYEAGLETIGINKLAQASRPDVMFAFVERSIVLDHMRQKIYIQSIKPEDFQNDDNWLSRIAKQLASLSSNCTAATTDDFENATSETVACELPSEDEYRAKIRKCQEYIRDGESYEICLTDQTKILISCDQNAVSSPWQRYTRQRRLNRAPFAAYVRLGSLTLLSTSPERFLCWSRPALRGALSHPDKAEKVSVCQFRPIKGTVKKTQLLPNGETKSVSLEEATAILSTPKERAENLMIVDLIRHDLHKVAGSGNVTVPALMVVEEYETVFQLVSVIEGCLRTPILAPRLPTLASRNVDEALYLSPGPGSCTGIDALAASLPPGSMTGAPKRRACWLLQNIEQQRPRSVYSGVVGYMCVTGKGDFSVVIRSAYKWDDETVHNTSGKQTETWHIGAGGAITDLSTETGEWEEMLTKLQSTLGSFAPGIKVN